MRAEQEFRAVVSKAWVDELAEEMRQLRQWLADEEAIDRTLEDLAEMLVEKHHDYGENNLAGFGELGILVRSSDKLARLRNLIDKEPLVADESREKTWMDLAGYALQALLMMRRAKDTEKVNLFQIRKNRLIRGFCPDCGEGVMLVARYPSSRVTCSKQCGFDADDVYELRLLYESHDDLFNHLAGLPAAKAQR